MIEGPAVYRAVMEVLSRHPESERSRILGVLFPDRVAARDERQPSRSSTPLPRGQ